MPHDAAEVATMNAAKRRSCELSMTSMLILFVSAASWNDREYLSLVNRRIEIGMSVVRRQRR
ncbi:MAG: hypothetical protein U0905_15920 [Pirellulales bacterium]